MFANRLSLITTFLGCLALATLHSCKNASDAPAAGMIDLSAIDSTVRPQDDFFTYANGAWLKRTVIPPSDPAWGSFYTLAEQSTSDIHAILDSLSGAKDLPKGSIEQKVGDLYASIMDSAGIEAKGLTPLKTDLARIDSIKDVQGILDEVAKDYRLGNAELYSFYVSPDAKNSAIQAVHFDQGGLGLPEKSYYFKTDSSIKAIRVAYQVYIKQLLTLAGEDSISATRDATGAMDAETALAKVSKSLEDLRDPLVNYHKLSIGELDKLTPGLSWKTLLTSLGIQQDTIIVGQPAFYTGMQKALHDQPLAEWKSYLKFHLIDNYAPVLTAAIVNANFAYSKLLSGQQEMRARWKRASTMVDQQLGEALGQLYVKKYFPPEAKKRMDELVDNLQATYADHIQKLDWMSDSTKKLALVKLHAIARKIGYPDKWKDYTSVTIDRNDVVENFKECSKFEYERNLHKIGKPVDKGEWFMTPPTVNAYYDPTANNVNFPAGILQPPFFFKDGDDAVNYGGIGFVIGHEMTHGFDDQGGKYDAVGNLKDWWTPQDAARFKQKTIGVVRQYDNYVSVDTFHLNGNLTQGENIADIGGLSLAYDAFKKTAQGRDTVRIDGLTPDQRFFLSIARVWRIKDRPENLRTGVMTDPHSSARFRVDGPLSDLNAFYVTYNVQPKDSMYRPDSLRAHIW